LARISTGGRDWPAGKDATYSGVVALPPLAGIGADVSPGSWSSGQ
jgi:hypothetical protein